jgi:hypothetical protein
MSFPKGQINTWLDNGILMASTDSWLWRDIYSRAYLYFSIILWNIWHWVFTVEMVTTYIPRAYWICSMIRASTFKHPVKTGGVPVHYGYCPISYFFTSALFLQGEHVWLLMHDSRGPSVYIVQSHMGTCWLGDPWWPSVGKYIPSVGEKADNLHFP